MILLASDPRAEEVIRLREQELMTFEEIAGLLKLSKQRIHQIYTAAGRGPTEVQRVQKKRYKRNLAKRALTLAGKSPEIETLYMKLGSAEEVAKLVGLPRDAVSRALRKRKGAQWLRVYRRQGARSGFSDEDILAALREAAKVYGPGLPIESYRDWSVFRDERPSSATVYTRFGSWNAAKAAAGLPTVNSTHPRQDLVTAEQCAVPLTACARELNRPPTYAEYEDWYKGRGYSPTIIRRRLGMWRGGPASWGECVAYLLEHGWDEPSGGIVLT